MNGGYGYQRNMHVYIRGCGGVDEAARHAFDSAAMDCSWYRQSSFSSGQLCAMSNVGVHTCHGRQCGQHVCAWVST